MSVGENHGAARLKYFRDRAEIMEHFKISRTRWFIHRSGDHVYAESDLGNTIWAKTILELQTLLESAGVDPRDIKIIREEFK